MMTKKNYETAAQIVQNFLPTNVRHAHRTLSAKEKREMQLEAKAVCVGFVLLFRDDNPRFDEEQFMTKCGVPS